MRSKYDSALVDCPPPPSWHTVDSRSPLSSFNNHPSGGLGKNDPFFLPPGAEAFKRDNPNATVKFLDTGHFALEAHADEIAAEIRIFLTLTGDGRIC